MQTKNIYQTIAEELATNNMDSALWTQAVALSDGNLDKTKAAYIRLRFIELSKVVPSPPPQAPNIQNPNVAQNPSDIRLSILRAELARKLSAQNRTSLYSTLGLQADVSDETVAQAIANFESSPQGASPNSMSAFKYAKETLGNPESRRQYDKELLNSVSRDQSERLGSTKSYESYGNSDAWWSSGKTAVVIGVLSLTLVGYLGLDFFKVGKDHEIKKETLDAQREIASSIIDTSNTSVNANIDFTQQQLTLQQERQRAEIELRNRMQDQQRFEQERRREVEQERIRQQQEQMEERRLQQQQQAENVKLQREKQYWVCVNQQLGQGTATTADAYSRCAYYR